MAWEKNGWWEEVQEGLEALRLGKRILVESGVAFTDIVEEEITAAPLSAIESAQFRPNLVQEDWNHAYHEDLDWLRPVDLAMMGKRETELMKQFASLAERRVQAMQEHLEGKAATDWIGQLQDEWTTTPQAQLEGRTPLAVILDEKRGSGSSTGYSETYLRRKLAELCAAAREALANCDLERARRYVGVVLDLDPEHPFGLRLRQKLEG